MYKIVNDQAPAYLTENIVYTKDVHSIYTRHLYHSIKFRLIWFKNIFVYRNKMLEQFTIQNSKRKGKVNIQKSGKTIPANKSCHQ